MVDKSFSSEITTAPYSLSLNTTTLTEGVHTISATARDAVGNTANATSVSITVSNIIPDTIAPTISLTSPTSGATVSDSITLLQVHLIMLVLLEFNFLIDGNPFEGELTSSPYSLSLNTNTLTNGVHTISATARDAAGIQLLRYRFRSLSRMLRHLLRLLRILF